MVSSATAESLYRHEPPEVARLLRAAHQRLFAYGYQAFTMAELAHDLGVSKKTLYVHFASKDAIIERIIDTLGQSLHERMDTVLNDPALKFSAKVAGVVATASETLARCTPSLLRDLQRFAPTLYQKIEDVRLKTIPVVFGKLIRTGIEEGDVRDDVDPSFATEFWLQAIRGLVQPSTLERTQLTLPQTLEKALHLFFAGLLSQSGRKDYEKQR